MHNGRAHLLRTLLFDCPMFRLALHHVRPVYAHIMRANCKVVVGILVADLLAIQAAS